MQSSIDWITSKVREKAKDALHDAVDDYLGQTGNADKEIAEKNAKRRRAEERLWMMIQIGVIYLIAIICSTAWMSRGYRLHDSETVCVLTMIVVVVLLAFRAVILE